MSLLGVRDAAIHASHSPGPNFRIARRSMTHHVSARMRRFVFLSFLAAAFGPFASAGLEWKNKIAELTPALFQLDTVATFPFTNTGTKPVTIVSATASCGCTVPALEKKTYAPGESGELKATYHIGEKTGSQHSTITVQTDPAGEGFVRLELSLQIPEPVAINPRVLSWNAGEAPEPKRIAVKIHPDTGWKAVEIATADTGWKYELKPGEAPGEYFVEIAPAQTETRGRAVFALVTDSPDKKRFALFSFVR